MMTSEVVIVMSEMGHSTTSDMSGGITWEHVLFWVDYTMMTSEMGPKLIS
jgi:hypothetical protein